MRILAIDGGGIRGVIPALVLAEIEERADRPVAQLFDLVAGTSTGGIIACALARPGAGGAPRFRAADLVRLYRDEGPRIFSRTPRRIVLSALGLLDEKYDGAGLERALESYLGDARLSEALVPLLVTAYDLESRTPYFFKSWRIREEPARDVRLADAARATAAAPTYFEPLRLPAADGSAVFSLVDGGVFATNPAMCAFAEAERLAPDDLPFLVSLGTGQLTRPIHHEDARGWGLVEWVRPLLDVVFDGVADTVDYQLRQLAPDGYHRFQVALTRASDALDDVRPANLERLEEHGRELIASASDELDRVVERLTRTT